MDKTKSGKVSTANFLKVAKVFGLFINQNDIQNYEQAGGYIDYEKALIELI